MFSYQFQWNTSKISWSSDALWSDVLNAICFGMKQILGKNSTEKKLKIQHWFSFSIFQCVRELCAANKENMPSLLRHTVFNELSNARNTNNMAILQVMFNHDKEQAPASLAEVFIELLMQKDCYLRALRALLREIVRYLRYDINLHNFCLHLMQLQVYWH